MHFIQKHNFLKAKQLRADMASLDTEFSQKTKEIFASAQGLADKDLVQAQEDIAKFRDETNAKADAEAAREVRATPKQLDIRLAGAKTVVLPEIPETRFEIPGSAPADPVPQVTSTRAGDSVADRKQMIEHELGIWLGLKRYSLAKKPNGVPDRTEDFREWQKKLLSAGN